MISVSYIDIILHNTVLELGWFVSQFAMPFYKVANQFSWFANSQYENNFLKAWIICPLSSIFKGQYKDMKMRHIKF